MSTSIYLDYNATAPMRPEALVALQEVLSLPHNPSSIHRYGRSAKALLERHRATLAKLLSCWPTELIFTGSGTEASNQIFHAFAGMPHIISAIEHDAVRQCAPDAAIIPVGEDGIIDLAALEAQLKCTSAPALVAVMAANNETGATQPLRDIAEIVHAHDGLFYADCAQALGKMPVDLTLMQADIASFSGHKIGAGCGAGLLYVRQGLDMPALLRGGGQEFGRRAGTENLAAIAAMTNAADAAIYQTGWQSQVRAWLDVMEHDCIKAAGDETIILSGKAPRLCNTSLIRMPGVDAQTQLMQFDLAGFAVSAGSACSSGKVSGSHVVAAMHNETVSRETVRVSAGWNSSKAEVNAFSQAWNALYVKMMSRTA